MAKLEEILGKSISTTKELKAEIIRLQESLAGLGTDEAALQTATNQLVAAQEQYNSIMAAGKQATDFSKDSIMGMEKEYKNLYNTYKMLTEEQRNSDFGKNMSESLNTLSTNLNKSKQDVGNYKDNIGRYCQSAMQAFNQMGLSAGALQGPLKIASTGVTGFKNAVKGLESGTVILMAIAVAFQALMKVVELVKNAIESDEESQMALNEAMSAFQPIIDLVKNALGELGKVVVKIINYYGNLVKAIEENMAKITDFLGITDGAEEKVKKMNQAYKDMTKSQNELTKSKREVQQLNSKDSATVANLREQASETDNATEKNKLLNEAKKVQEEINERNIALAEKELEVLEMEAEKTANDAAMNDKLAAAKAKVNDERAKASQEIKALNKQIKASTTATKSHTAAVDKDKEALKELLKQIKENNMTEEQKLTEKYKEDLRILKKYHQDTTELTKQYNDKMEALQLKRVANEASISAAEDEVYFKAIERYYGHLASLREQDKKLTDNIKTFEATYKELSNLQSSGKSKYTAQKDLDSLASMFGIDLGDAQVLSVEQRLRKLKIIIENSKDDLTKILKERRDIIAQYIENRNKLVETAARKENLEKLFDVTSPKFEENKKTIESAYGTFLGLYETVSKAESEAIFNAMALISKQDSSALNSEVEATQAKINELKRQMADINAITEYRNLTDAENDKYNDLNDEVVRLETQKAEFQMEIAQRAFDYKMNLLNLELQRNNELKDSIMENFKSITNLTNGFTTMYKAEIQSGKLSQKEIENKKKKLQTLEKVQYAVTIASIIGDTASSIMGIWRGYSGELVANAETASAAGPAAAGVLATLNAKSLASAIIKTTTTTALGVSQLAAARGNHISNVTSISSLGGSEGSSSSAAATVTTNTMDKIDSSAYSYTRTLQTEEEEALLNRPIYVSVTDINDAQSKVQVREEESTF